MRAFDLVAVASLLGLAACVPEASDTPETPPEWCEGSTSFRYDPLGSAEILAFPDDALTVADDQSPTGRALAPSRAVWTDAFPDFLVAIWTSAEGLSGFGRYGAVVLRFDAPLGDLPADVDASLQDAGLRFLDLSTSPPTRVPYAVTPNEDRTQVVLQPLQPLSPGAAHLVVLTQDHAAADGGCVAPPRSLKRLLWGDDTPADLAFLADDLRGDLEAAGLTPADVGAAVRFTTHDEMSGVAQAAADIASREGSWGDEVSCEQKDGHRVCDLSFVAQDYRGPLGIPRSGEPAGSWELPVRAWIPDGEGPWPLVMFGHGMNGSRREGGAVYSRVGLDDVVVVALDALEHGDHPTAADDDTLDGAAFLGVDFDTVTLDGTALRGNFLQTALDRAQLVQRIVDDPDLDGDGEDDVDTDRIGYMGVSLGGMMGPGLMATSSHVDAGVWWVAGGHLITFATDTDLVAILLPLIKDLLGSEEAFQQFLAVGQASVDAADPAVLAAHVLRDRFQGPDAAPHLMLSVAEQDEVVPPTTGRHLARALGIPHVPPVRTPVPLLEVTDAAPVSGNVDGRTQGFFQYDRVGGGAPEAAMHGNTPFSPEGRFQTKTFLEAWRDGDVPPIVDPYEALMTSPLP